MSILNHIAYFQDRRDATPNQELARNLVEKRDQEGVQELVANLQHAEQHVRSDCLKMLYEVGYLKPEFIADYANEFLRLLCDRSHRMVWGSLVALATITPLRPDELYQHRPQIQDAMAKDPGITPDNGVKILATVAVANDTYHEGTRCRSRQICGKLAKLEPPR